MHLLELDDLHDPAAAPTERLFVGDPMPPSADTAVDTSRIERLTWLYTPVPRSVLRLGRIAGKAQSKPVDAPRVGAVQPLERILVAVARGADQTPFGG
jgi:hypothetical protein